MTRASMFLGMRWGLCLILFLSACTPRLQEIRMADVPVSVFGPGTHNVDTEVMLESVTQTIHKVLPGAYFQGVVFSAKCQALPQLQGRFVLVFTRERPAIPKPRVERATASVDVARQMMDVHIRDETDFHPSTKRLTLNNELPIQKIAAIAYQHIAKSGLSDCDVTLTQLDRSWDVRCGPLEDFVQKCHFEIDASSGEVISGAR